MSRSLIKVLGTAHGVFGIFTLGVLLVTYFSGQLSELHPAQAALKFFGSAIGGLLLVACAWFSWKRPRLASPLAWLSLVAFVGTVSLDTIVIYGIQFAGELMPVFYYATAVRAVAAACLWYLARKLSTESVREIENSMYFWRITDLEKKLQERPLTERESLPYLLVYVTLTMSMTLIPVESMYTWDYVVSIGSLLVTVAGTFYAYRCNGGASGNHFLQRYFAIGWVVAIRWAVVTIPLYILLIIVVGAQERMTWQGAVYFIIAMVVFYQRFCHHIRQVANPAWRANSAIDADAKETRSADGER